MADRSKLALDELFGPSGESARRAFGIDGVRPVVDAAEALVEHWDGSARGIEYYDVREQLEDALAEKVKEAQR